MNARPIAFCALLPAAGLVAACASGPRGFIVDDVDAFVARDERTQVFHEDAAELRAIGQSTVISSSLFKGEKRIETTRYYFKNPRVEGLLEVSARKRKDGWEIVDMDVDYTYYTVEPRDWHRILVEK